jgi:serine protease Do
MKSPRFFVPLLAALLAAGACFAETVKDREGAVRGDRAAMQSDARWIYSDVERGFIEARRTGKPLLAVFRCIPCLACAGIDASVIDRETDLAPLLGQFVCVRVIDANALDLSRFQFDFDLSFSAIFFNGDGTIYGRYGSWRHQKDPQDKTTAGLRRALEAALAIHRGYPANKTALAGKQAAPFPFRTPVEMPGLNGKYTAELNWNGKVVQSCVHCHQIGDALRLSFREKKEPIPIGWIYPFPAPETVGLALAPDRVARIDAVAPDSAAARAGLRPGDDITSLAGQPLISPADVSWVLHRAPAAGPLPAMLKRADSSTAAAVLDLPEGWRMKTDISRRAGTWPMRGMALGGLVLEELTADERARRSLAENGLALRVKSVGQYGKHAAAKNAGFQKDDIIIDMDAFSNRLTESELIGQLLQRHHPGETVKATVLRGAERVQLTLPMQ